MKEKERYVNRDGVYDTVIDDYVKTDILVNLLNQQDKQLADYEHEIENYQHELEVYKTQDITYANNIRHFADKGKKEVSELKNKLKVMEIAFKNACKHIDYVVTKEGLVCSGLSNENVDKIEEHFKTTAEEEVRNEQNDRKS